nr:MAG TPA: factor VII active site mutant fc, protein A, fc [Caudoviricetes sp.]
MSTLSVLSLVNARFEEEKTSNDDQQHCYDAIVDSLTDEQKDIFLKECDIAESLEKEHGLFNVTPEMYEKAFADAGLE